MQPKIERYNVKLFLDSIVEGPGEGLRGQIMLSVHVYAASQIDARGVVEEKLTRLLQDDIDGEIVRERNGE